MRERIKSRVSAVEKLGYNGIIVVKHTQRPVTAVVNWEAGMTKEAFLAFCGAELGTEPDYPFDEDFETAVLCATREAANGLPL